ncbi:MULTISPECIES: AraC family transcriptional regulator [Streptomyces]|uniref:AraC family transcriptional regulator n=1 Tax=Streptomyces TaxID=1883 RepID=UPI0019911002|nr:AraC family transcriptional regulator [Streptomyces umbrinus]MCR3731689.1 AraC-like DNA-binding protein [Streptomyces umbrinus]MCX4560874.1 AraC family transcriptional regulator [Streptomyces phaeochromogenes]GHH64815.1 AraC family transcriptional regulator [Streptomyces umbrinus]
MPAGTYIVESQTTGEVDPRERTDFWSEHVGSYQTRMDFRYASPETFRGEMIRQGTDTYQIVDWSCDKIEYVRTPRLVRQEPDPDYRFLLPLSGELVLRQDDQEARLTPGAGSLMTLGAPFQLLHDASLRGIIFSIPAREIDGRLNRKSPLATGIDLTTGLGRVVGSMIESLSAERDSLTTTEFNAVSDRIVELLCMITVGDDRPDSSGHLTEVEAVVRRHVREHAADPGLTGTSMARALGWSLRQIQLALQRVGTTPRELIREERLRLVRDRLQCGECEHMTITDLAYASGFSSASALSTAFKQRYGVSPREMRHGVR